MTNYLILIQVHNLYYSVLYHHKSNVYYFKKQSVHGDRLRALYTIFSTYWLAKLYNYHLVSLDLIWSLLVVCQQQEPTGSGIICKLAGWKSRCPNWETKSHIKISVLRTSNPSFSKISSFAMTFVIFITHCGLKKGCMPLTRSITMQFTKSTCLHLASPFHMPNLHLCNLFTYVQQEPLYVFCINLIAYIYI